MKAIKTILSIALACAVMTLAACGGKSTNPVDQFADSLDKIAGKVEKFTSEKDFESVTADMEAADKIVTDNADLTLTDADRVTIKKAITTLYRATLSKSFEIAGQELDEAQLETMLNTIAGTIDNMTTFGQLNSQPGAPMEAEEDVIEAAELTDTETPAAE